MELPYDYYNFNHISPPFRLLRYLTDIGCVAMSVVSYSEEANKDTRWKYSARILYKCMAVSEWKFTIDQTRFPALGPE